MEIKAIQCPNCGSTQKTEIRPDHFRCESCGTEYVLNSGKTTIYVQGTTPPATPAKRKTVLYAALGIGLVLFILVAVIVSSSSNNSYTPSAVSEVSTLPDHRWDWRQSKLFSTPDGKPVLMSIGVRTLDHPGSTSEETTYVVFADAETGKKLKSVPLPHFNTETSIRIREFSSGDLYFIPQSSMVFRVDKGSLSVTDVSSSLFAKQPELANGVATIEFTSYENEDGFKLITNDGKNLAFFPLVHKTYSNDELWTAEQGFSTVLPGAKEKTGFAFITLFSYDQSSDNLRPQLMKYRFLDNGGGPKQPVGMLPKGLNDLNQKKPRVISYTDFTPGRFYFSDKMMYYDDDYVFIAFQPTAGNSGKGDQLQCLDAKTGRIMFTSQIPDDTNISAGDAIRTKDGFSILNYNKVYNIGLDGKFHHQTQPSDYEF